MKQRVLLCSRLSLFKRGPAIGFHRFWFSFLFFAEFARTVWLSLSQRNTRIFVAVTTVMVLLCVSTFWCKLYLSRCCVFFLTLLFKNTVLTRLFSQLGSVHLSNFSCFFPSIYAVNLKSFLQTDLFTA